MKNFAEKVKAARAELGITQLQLAKQCGVSLRTIMSYEQDNKTPRANTLIKLAKALKVSTKFLSDEDCSNPMEDIEKDGYIEQARSLYGKKGEVDINKLLEANESLFAGGELPQEQKDAYFEAVMRLYVTCKETAAEKFGKKS